ncbi:E3 ubiquitin-protein ligase TRIM47-like isoform X4 [Brienomyrus brachyistius]|uniref:E3 ubiquitin-protein ligase TRIM47-like isoform X4 n=1 Tax=Brienomyrus brachyistius TaxID=42636 RepID=UPI0020B1C911|nr:E3 ubiquitin-protein ligase TRIM47-like isoform X4 [Brienomyrus brachyistius]
MALSILTDQDQFKCLICLHLLEDPVTIPCRHSFCMDCIKRVWDWNDVTGIYNCPCCSKNFSPQPNLTIDVILNKKVEEIRRSRTRETLLSSSAGKKRKAPDSPALARSVHVFGIQKDMVCALHHRPLDVYCRTDQRSICSQCVTELHQPHETVSVVTERKMRQEQLAMERNRFQKKLQERERKLLETRMTLESFRRWPLPSLPAEPDDPPNLVVDLQLPLEMMKAALSDLKRQIGDMCDAEVMRISNTANDPSSTHGSSAAPERPSIPEQSDPEQSDREPSSRPEFLKYACHLTFDPNTANHELTLSADGQEVTRGDKEYYAIFPEKFVSKSQVLCREVLSGGRFYWEAELEGTKAEVAVTYRGISRKGTTSRASFGANDQSWSLDCINGVYSACYNMKRIDIRVPYSPRVGVYLDHKAGTLSFYSVSDTMTLLHRYQTTFHEPMCAGFWVGSGVTIKLCHLQQ